MTSLRLVPGLLAIVATLLASGGAVAEICFTDKECPEPECGGQICWMARMCRPVDSGVIGWCITDDDCKCKNLGARCESNWCTITSPAQVDGGGVAADAGSPPATTNDAGPGVTTSKGGCALGGGAPLSWLALMFAGAQLLARRRLATPVRCFEQIGQEHRGRTSAGS